MTAMPQEPGPSGHPLRRGASPQAVRRALRPEDQPRFDEAYRRALTTASEQLDLTELHFTVEQWRRVAAMQSDPEGFTHAVRRAAELTSGAPVPKDEPLEITRARAGM